MYKVIYIFIAVLYSVKANKEFRSDYTYYHDIDGWLKLHKIPATWQDARQWCILEDAVLASPISEKMISALNSEINKSSTECGIYTGVHSIFSKGYFVSIEGEPLTKMPVQWMPYEPDNAGNNEDCIAYIHNRIADVNCSEVLPFACFKENSQHMHPQNICGTTDEEYIIDHKTGRCYKYHTFFRTWSEAFKVCLAEGAYLAVMSSEDEVKFVLNMIGQKGGAKSIDIFLGYNDWDKNGDWRTVFGQTLKETGYAEWSKGQPDNNPPGQYCGAMFGDGLLDDAWCDTPYSFVCEKETASSMH